MTDNQQIAVRGVGEVEFPPYTSEELAVFSAEAQERERIVIELGGGADQIRVMQLTHLKWFAEDPRRIQVLGYPDIFTWASGPEISKAIWGADANASSTTRERFVRTLRLQMAVPEINVFSAVPRSFHSDGTFAEIEAAARGIPDIPEFSDNDLADGQGGDEDDESEARKAEREAHAQAEAARAEAIEKLRDKIDNEKTKKWEERRKNANKNRASKFGFAAGDGIIRYQGTPVIKLVPEAGEVGAEMLHLILRPNVRFIIDADLIKAWIGEELVIVGRILNADEHLTNLIVDALRAERNTS